MWQILAAAAGTMAFAVLFRAPGRDLFLCGAGGGAGWSAYLLLRDVLCLGEFAAVRGATGWVALLARAFAVWRKCPATIFLVTGIFPLVPGTGVYWMVYSVMAGQLHAALGYGVQSIETAIAVVLGILVAFEIPRRVFGGRRG